MTENALRCKPTGGSSKHVGQLNKQYSEDYLHENLAGTGKPRHHVTEYWVVVFPATTAISSDPVITLRTANMQNAWVPATMLGCNQVDFFLTTGVPGWNKIQHMLLAWCCGYKTARTHCTKRLTNPSQGPDARECTQWPCKLPLHDSHCNMQRCMASHMRDSRLAGYSVSNFATLTKRLSVRNWQKRGRFEGCRCPKDPPLYSLSYSTLGWRRVYSEEHSCCQITSARRTARCWKFRKRKGHITFCNHAQFCSQFVWQNEGDALQYDR